MSLGADELTAFSHGSGGESTGGAGDGHGADGVAVLIKDGGGDTIDAIEVLTFV